MKTLTQRFNESVNNEAKFIDVVNWLFDKNPNNKKISINDITSYINDDEVDICSAFDCGTVYDHDVDKLSKFINTNANKKIVYSFDEGDGIMNIKLNNKKYVLNIYRYNMHDSFTNFIN